MEQAVPVIAADPGRGLIEVRFAGEVGLDEREATARKVVEEVARSGVRRVLLDFRQAHSRAEDSEAGREFVERFGRTFVQKHVRLAYVVQHEHQLNPSIEQLLAEHGVPARRFFDHDAAVAWLAELDPPLAGADREPGTDWATWID